MPVVRVAYFTDCYHEVNGIATTSRKLVGFAAARHLPMLVVHCGEARKTTSDGSITDVQLRRGWATLPVERDFGFDPALWRERYHVARALGEFQPDIIHVTSPGDVGLLGLYLARRLRIPIVASWHTNLHEFAARRLLKLASWAPAEKAERLSLRLLGLFYSAASVTLAPNPEWVRWLSDRTGRPSFLMSRGVDTALFDPAKRTIRDEIMRIGYVGRVSPEKNVRILARIRQSLLASGHRNVRFVIVGDGSELPWLRKNMPDAEFPGVLRGGALAEACANLDVLLFPSHTDTFGNVVLEAMASGVVPVVSRAGGPKYIVDEGITGFVAREESQFAFHAETLISSPERLRCMRRSARKKAEGASWDRVFEKVYEAYSLAARSSGDAPVRPIRGRRLPEPA